MLKSQLSSNLTFIECIKYAKNCAILSKMESRGQSDATVVEKKVTNYLNILHKYSTYSAWPRIMQS